MYFIASVFLLIIDTLLFSLSETLTYSHLEFCVNNKIVTPCNERSLETPSLGCIEYEKIIRTDSEKEAVLDRINSRRNKVASGEIRSLPSANNMQKLTWSSELEQLALKWANQCVKGSVPDLKDDCIDLTSVGQNIATVYGEAPGLVPQSLVDIWYMELLHINYSVIHQYKPSILSSSPFYDHFTQLIWATTIEVGCAGVRFKECIQEGGVEKNISVYRLVCNFSPSGNILNKEVYETGPSCSQCSVQNSCDPIYRSLCPSDDTSYSVELRAITKSKSMQSKPYQKAISYDLLANGNKGSKENEKLRDDLIPYDFLSNIRHLSIPSISIPTTTQKNIFFTDGVKVDDLVEILKKKLSTDIMFKNILVNKNIHSEGEILDPKVEEFVGQIYTSRTPTTISKSANSEYVNSTLLADLIEAVIFRNAQRNEVVVSSTESIRPIENFNPIFPTKIQAELGEIPTNKYFTGHFFIPEEMDEASLKVTTEVDYESYADRSTQIPLTDILSEIENIRKQKVTKDFLSELLESEYASENTEAQNGVINPEPTETTSSTEYSEARKKRHDVIDKSIKYKKTNLKSANRYLKSDKYSEGNTGYLIKYSELLKQLAADVNALKIREKFACGWTVNKSMSHKRLNYVHILVFLYIVK